MLKREPLAISNDLLCPVLPERRNGGKDLPVGGVGIDPVGELRRPRRRRVRIIADKLAIDGDANPENANQDRQNQEQPAALRERPEKCGG